MLGARDDTTITLDGDLPITETEVGDKTRDGRTGVHRSALTINDYVDVSPDGHGHAGTLSNLSRGGSPPAGPTDPTVGSQHQAVTQSVRCDDHDMDAVVSIGFVKLSSQEKGVARVATTRNHIPRQPLG